jgi:class 3 adenylate cyclase
VDKNEHNKTILVVDDAPTNIQVVNSILKDIYKIRIATNGAKALELVKVVPYPDLILLDVQMPDMDGYEVCTRLKADAETRDIPVIFLTAQTEITDETRGFDVGAVDYIHKPFSPAVVKARVRTHLALREKTELIEEKNRENEALLLNILPREIVNRLKGGENEIADNFADVTVLFGDIVGFTGLSSTISAAEIVEMLNGLFSRFDQVANELGIEKIKTIGDCYMAVCGLPTSCSDHADRMARMALRMVEVTRERGNETGLNLQMRIGLNSGPVVAGVIGTSKFIYDLWGDTVNLASRMESNGVPGQIQVTRNVYERLKDSFVFDSRGVIQVKGKGEIETWLLQRELHRMEATIRNCGS